MTQNLNPKEWYRYLLAALQDWHNITSQAYRPFASLLAFRTLSEQSAAANSPHEVLVQLLEKLLAEMLDRNAADLLLSRFRDETPVAEMAHRLSVTVESAQRHQKHAIVRSFVPALITHEQQCRNDQVAIWEGRLARKTYDKLFGVAALEAQLIDHLLDPTASPIVTIMGLGGVGKSAIADKVTRAILQEFHYEHVLWVRYEPSGLHMMPQSAEEAYETVLLELSKETHIAARELPPKEREARVRFALHKTPHLIVVDNIEQPSSMQTLLERLTHYSGDSRFMVTSRAETDSFAQVRPYRLQPLSLENSITYVQHLAQQVGFRDFVNAAPAQLRPIYDLVGGNPLALKLAVGLGQKMSFERLCKELRNGLTEKASGLYTHIYRNLWGILSPNGQRLLGAMLFVKDSASAEFLQRHSELSDVEFSNAVDELTVRSLLEPRGSVWDRSFGVHRLTKTFLMTELWGGSGHASAVS